MSLKIEQKLKNNCFTEMEPKIYTTGAFLVPMEIVVNEERSYIWVADEFEGDSYNKEGKICSPLVFSTKKKDLLNH